MFNLTRRAKLQNIWAASSANRETIATAHLH